VYRAEEIAVRAAADLRGYHQWDLHAGSQGGDQDGPIVAIAAGILWATGSSKA